MVKDFNIEAKNIRLMEKSTGINLHDRGSGDSLPKMTLKPQRNQRKK